MSEGVSRDVLFVRERERERERERRRKQSEGAKEESEKGV
jgi:hypothetical protein